MTWPSWRRWLRRRSLGQPAVELPVVDTLRETVDWLADTADLARRRVAQGCAYTSADAEMSWDLLRDGITHGSQ